MVVIGSPLLAGAYASHYDYLGYGGYRSVADNTERNAIINARCVEGMMVYVRSTDKLWKLKSGFSNPTVDGDWEEVVGLSIASTDISNWNAAYGWGNHATAGYLTSLSGLTTDDLTQGSTNLYDKTVALTAGTGISISGTYPNFTITNTGPSATDHAALTHLAYADSGHTGFVPATRTVNTKALSADISLALTDMSDFSTYLDQGVKTTSTPAFSRVTSTTYFSSTTGYYLGSERILWYGGGSNNTNIALGYGAMPTASGAVGNSTNGYQALTALSSGDYNSAFGYRSLYANTTGSNNTAFGAHSLRSNITGTNNVGLGYYAGAYETGSNAFYVDNQDRTNTAGDKANALMYGTFAATSADQELKVNADLIVKHALTANFNTVITNGTQSLTIENYAATVTGLGTVHLPCLTPSVNELGGAALATHGTHAVLSVNDESYAFSLAHYNSTTGVINAVDFNLDPVNTIVYMNGGFSVGQSGSWYDLYCGDLEVNGSIGTTGNRVTKIWATDIECTNAIVASITGTAAKATNLVGGNNTTLLGSIPYQSNTDTTTLLAPNTTTTEMYLSQTGNGTNGAAPTWKALSKSSVGLGNVDNVQQMPLSYLDTDTTLSANSDTKVPSQKAIKAYADGLVVGLLDYRGAYDASGNVFPSTGGSGTAGAVLKGDMWIISVAGTLGSVAVQIGDSVIANVDTPGQTASNWNVLNGNISYVPENAANKVTSISGSSTDTQYPSAKLLYDQLAGKQASYAILSTFGVLANASGWLKNDGAGVLSYSTPSKSDVGLGNVENTALSTWGGSANLATLGTVSTGTWSATAIAANKGGTGQTSYTVGDLLYASSTSALSKLAAVAAGSILASAGTGTAPAWTSSPSVSGSLTAALGVYAGTTYGFYLGSIKILSYGGGGIDSNIAVGYSVLASNTTGFSNSAIGKFSLVANTTGDGNSAMGYYALGDNTIGNGNVAIGSQALYSNVDGNYNIGIGASVSGTPALYSNVDGNYNIGIGSSSLFSNISGDYNVALGIHALYSSTGNRNIALGYRAGYYETGSDAFYVDSRNRTNTAGDKAGAILYGIMSDTPSSQTLTTNSSFTVTYDFTVNGNTTLGNASTDTITATGRFIPRLCASDPKHATAASRPAGTLGEVARYGTKLYICTNASTPTWELITSA